MPTVDRELPAPVPDPWNRLADTVQNAAKLWEEQARAERRWRLVKRLGIASFIAFSALLYFTWYVSVLGVRLPTFDVGYQVAVVTVEGAIGRGRSASADTLGPLIDKACNASLTKAMVIRVRSPGGDPSESARIGARIQACQEKGRDVIAFIDGMGASGGYLVAIHADVVVADRYAYVGSIGAVSTQWDAKQLIDQFGLSEHAFVTGDLKYPSSLVRPPDERAGAYIQGLVDAVGQQFLADVQSRRASRLAVPVQDLYTGQVWISSQALELGLIDKVADFETEIHSRWPQLSIKHYQPRQTLLGGMQIAHDVGEHLATGVMSAIGQQAAAAGAIDR